MKLSEYLKQENLTASEFAARIQRSVSTVTRAARGEVMPDPETTRRIADITGGSVQPNDFFAEAAAWAAKAAADIQEAS